MNMPSNDQSNLGAGGTPIVTTPAPVVTPTAPTETPAETITRLTDEVKKARAEAGKERVTAKENAAKEATTETLKRVGVALGLIVEENPDPVKLLAQVQESQGKAKFAEVQLAVYHAADELNGNAKALLDSRSFLEKVAAIDSSDQEALKAVIADAIKENPLLAKSASDDQSRPLGPRPDLSQGSGGNARPSTKPEDAFAAWWRATSSR